VGIPLPPAAPDRTVDDSGLIVAEPRGLLLDMDRSLAPHVTPDDYCLKVARNFQALAELSGQILRAAGRVSEALKAGRKIMLCGNGGSAADCQHLAAELVGRYHKDRRPLPAIALTVDTSALTAISNDYSFTDVFSRQLQGIGCNGDVLIAISTSGSSANVLSAIEAARGLGIATIGLTGKAGGKMRSLCDQCLCVPSDETNHIQEMHIAIGHMICGLVESDVCPDRS
jgi:D-sedoheptulose 7-phosphate isomerase